MSQGSSSNDRTVRILIGVPAQAPREGLLLVPRRGAPEPVLKPPAQAPASGPLLVPKKGLPHPILIPPAQSPRNE